MTHTARRAVVALLLVSMVSGLSAQGARPGEADLKEVANYKLTMATVEKVKVVAGIGIDDGSDPEVDLIEDGMTEADDQPISLD